MMTWQSLLIGAALVLCIVEQVRTRGQSVIIWAVSLLALALAWPLIR